VATKLIFGPIAMGLAIVGLAYLVGVVANQSVVVGIALLVAAVALAGSGFDAANGGAYIALFGVALAGLGTYLTTTELDKRSDARDARTRDAAVQGTARLMQEEFYIRLEDLAATWSRGDFPDRPQSLATTLSNESRIEVAAELRPDEWKALANGDVRIPRADRLLRRRLKGRVGDQKDDRPGLCDAMRRFRGAAIALQRLAGQVPNGLKPVPPGCAGL
jgi:hypothetical protein